MTTAVRAGIVGTGFMGRVHAHAVRATGNVVAAVVGSSRERAESARGALGAERVADDLADLLAAGDLDIVHICTPNALHVAQARQVLEHGLAVVCEKPLATSARSAAELAELAAAKDVAATVPFVYRFYPLVRAARQRVAAGVTGPVRLVHGGYLQDWLSDESAWNWRVDVPAGGPSRAFADIGVHWCDLAEFVTGHRIVALAARTFTTQRTGPDGSRRTPATEDAVAIQFETDGGALGSAMISQVSPGRKNSLRIGVDGARSAIGFDQEQPETLWLGGTDGSTLLARGEAATGTAAQRYDEVPPGHPQGYQDCFNAFVADSYRALRGAPVDGLPTFADGARAARLAEAVLAAAAAQRWVEVP